MLPGKKIGETNFPGIFSLQVDSKPILEAYLVLAFNCDKPGENKDCSCSQTSVPVDQNYIWISRG